MLQEVTEQVDQLGIADDQPKLLTFYDRKGRFIRETETPGGPDIVNTNISDDEDGLEDLNPPTADNDYGPGNIVQDIPRALAKTVEQPEDAVEEPGVHQDDFQVQDPKE